MIDWNMEYDAVIVGAGPAGSHTARFAAEGGAKVVIIEKRQEVGSPVRCAEGAARRSLQEAEVIIDPKWISGEMDGAMIIAPNGNYLEVDEAKAGAEVGYVIERDLFDQALAKTAVQRGAELVLKCSATALIKDDTGKVCGVKVNHMGEEKEIRAKLVIGADGHESLIGRWAGLLPKLEKNDIISGLQYRMTNLDINHKFVQFYLTKEFAPGGYIWIFPKDETTANVGIGIVISEIKHKGHLKELLDGWIAANPKIAQGEIIDIIAGGIPVGHPVDATVMDGLMLVGDAGRQTDPITGGGIGNGCKAGRECGLTIAAAVKANDFSAKFLQMYETAWRDLLEERLYRNWMAKEACLGLDDDVFNKIITTMDEVGITEVNVFNLLVVIKDKHPELVEKFQDLI